MSSYLNQINYDSFLQSALQQQAQVQNVEDLQASLFAQAQQAYKANQTENKDSGIESLFLFAPEATQKFTHLIVKGKELYSKLGELKAQGSKVIDGLKTLPDDLKAKYSDKVNEIETLMKDGSNEAIEKATKSYNSLIDVANKTKVSGEGILNKVSTEASDSINRGIKSTKSITSDLENKVNSTASTLDSQFIPELKSKATSLLTNIKNESRVLEKPLVIGKKLASGELPSDLSSLSQGAMDRMKTLIREERGLQEMPERDTLNPSLKEQNALEKAGSRIGEIRAEQQNLMKRAGIPVDELADGGKNIINDLSNKLFESNKAQTLKSAVEKQFTPLTENIGSSISSYEPMMQKMVKIPVSIKSPSGELVNRYKDSVQKVSDLESSLRSEKDPFKISKLNTDLDNAKASVRMNDRLMQLETVNTSIDGTSMFKQFSQGVSKATEIGGNILGAGGAALMTVQEAKGQMKSPLDIAQTTQMQADIGGVLAQKGAQAITKLQEGKTAVSEAVSQGISQGKQAVQNVAEQGKQALSEGVSQGKQIVQAGLNEGKQAVTQVAEQGQKLAGDIGQQIGSAKTAVQSTLSESLQGAKSALSPLSDLAGETASKGSGILESIGEKGVLETLGEATGIAAIPVVGEIASLGLLATGIFEGVKDIFGGGEKAPAPPPPMAIASPAGLVRQAGI